MNLPGAGHRGGGSEMRDGLAGFKIFNKLKRITMITPQTLLKA